MLGGAFIRMGTVGWALGEDIFPIEFGMVAFVGSIILCTAEDILGPSVGSRLKPCHGPPTIIPVPGYIV